MRLLFIILFYLISENLIGQNINGFYKDSFAAKSTCPIESIEIYRSMYPRRRLRRVNTKFAAKNMERVSTEEYNDSDNLASDLMEGNGQIGWSNYIYNDDGKLIEIQRIVGTIIMLIKRKYVGNKIIIQTIQNNKVISTSIQILNKQNRISNYYFLNEAKDTIGQYCYTYDLDGNEIESKRIHKDRVNNYTRKNFYDPFGKLIRTEHYNFEGKLTSTTVIEEVKDSKFKDLAEKYIHVRKKHTEIINGKNKKYVTEKISLIDDCNNVYKFYTNEFYGKGDRWQTYYLDIKYR
ncbi:MAG: hypothetical protein AAF573_19640 [Bacteroidota bacterium]